MRPTVNDKNDIEPRRASSARVKGAGDGATIHVFEKRFDVDPTDRGVIRFLGSIACGRPAMCRFNLRNVYFRHYRRHDRRNFCILKA